MPKSKKAKPAEPEYPKVYESFNEPYISTLRHEPFCINYSVEVRKYRTTIEIVEEPIEVIHERLEKLWRECDNIHHWTPLENEAKKYSYTFKSPRGCDVKKK